MGYLVEQYREDRERLMKKLYKAKMAICEAMEELEEMDTEEEMNSRNFRMNNRMNNRGRYDY